MQDNNRHRNDDKNYNMVFSKSLLLWNPRKRRYCYERLREGKPESSRRSEFQIPKASKVLR